MDYPVTGETSSEYITKVQGLILTEIVNPLLSISVAFALVWMMYGIVRFIAFKNKDANEMERGKKHIVWSLVGLFILVSIWGIMIMTAEIVSSDVWFLNKK